MALQAPALRRFRPPTLIMDYGARVGLGLVAVLMACHSAPESYAAKVFETVDGAGYVKFVGPTEAEIRINRDEPTMVGTWSEEASGRVRIALETLAGRQAVYFRQVEGGLVGEGDFALEVFEGAALAMRRDFQRAEAASRAGNCRESIRLFQHASELGHPRAQSGLAWELATAADPGCQDGPRSLAAARAALQHGETAELFDTLAAAYARNGDFDSALEAQGKALALLKAQPTQAPSREREQEYQDRWSLYELRQPYERASP